MQSRLVLTKFIDADKDMVVSLDSPARKVVLNGEIHALELDLLVEISCLQPSTLVPWSRASKFGVLLRNPQAC